MLNRILGALCLGMGLIEFAAQSHTAPLWVAVCILFFQFASMQSNPRQIFLGEFKEFVECR